jgi:hypothetical protein
MAESERPFTDKQPVVADEAAVVGLLPSLAVAPAAIEVVDTHLAIGQGLVAVDAFVVYPVERQPVIGLPAVGVDDLFQLELFQLGDAVLTYRFGVYIYCQISYINIYYRPTYSYSYGYIMGNKCAGRLLVFRNILGSFL